MAAPENLLRHQASPYLLQHAANPVHWRPWGAEALAEARESDRPILLSIGYAACHWCHVMAHESFENPDTAAMMNALYVNVKVDREERPDIDQLYMNALHALGESGGWPLTMFLTPDGEPFWGGTYFPPAPRWGKPSFRQVLQGVAEAWRSQHEAITQNIAALKRALASQSAARPGAMIGPQTLDAAALTLLRAVDPVNGGLQGAPKFPNAPIYRFLWQNHFRTGRAPGAEATHQLLRSMSQGGIYDHLGGGYSRYATDSVWLVPHFEKMLYDNAQLLELLALAAAAVPDPLYAARAGETVGWLVRDMTAAARDGHAAFAASEDADSDGEEGKFYVWTEAEVDGLLGADGPAFKRAYDVTAAGNWEGHTILRRTAPPGDPAQEAVLARARATLLTARSRRVRPGRDDKVLADWNGLVIAALCRAGAVFRRPDWLARAALAFDFIHATMRSPDGRLRHAWRLGRLTAAGLLDDQAAMARAALALFEATGDPVRLDQALALVAAAETFFADADGSFFLTARDARDVPLGEAGRPRTVADNATPAANGLMAEVFARLFHLTGAPAWADRARRLIGAFSGLGEGLAMATTLLAAADLLEEGTLVVVAGDPALPATAELLRVALAAPDPAVCVLRAEAGTLPDSHPAHGKSAPPGGAAAFVCRGGTCASPVSDPALLAAGLRARGRTGA
jgi:uncharacterized protein YyaL (SSP411 family)